VILIQVNAAQILIAITQGVRSLQFYYKPDETGYRVLPEPCEPLTEDPIPISVLILARQLVMNMASYKARSLLAAVDYETSNYVW
jgi:hypothetical protein